MGSSWPINIFKGGLKPVYLNFLSSTVILSSSRSRAAPNPSHAHAAQLDILVTGLGAANNAVLFALLGGIIQE